MALATTYARSSLAIKYATEALWAALYTTTPGASAGTEVSGGSPAYARKSVTWTQNGAGQATASVVFDVPSGANVLGCGFHTASTGGTYVDGVAFGAAQQFTSQGALTVTLTITIS